MAHLARDDFDVVLVDYVLALRAGDGRDSLLGEVRRYPPMTVALILTGGAGEVSMRHVLREGAADHVLKPYDPEVLKAIVGRAIERVAVTRSIRALTEDLDEANAQLRAASDALQRRVEEATAALGEKVAALRKANRQLADANRRLEAAHREREEFVSMIAHELGNPLTAVSGYIEFIGRPGVPPAAQERARATVLSETKRMARLIEDLADAARLASGRFQIRLARCDLGSSCIGRWSWRRRRPRRAATSSARSCHQTPSGSCATGTAWRRSWATCSPMPSSTPPPERWSSGWRPTARTRG
jgi:signal transduction histidine kinase